MPDVSGRITVMQLVYSLRMGGSEKVAMDISSHLDPGGFQPHVCAMDLDGELARELERDRIPYHVMHRKGLEPRVLARLYRLMKRHRVDVVHTHHFTQLFYAALPARLAGVRIIHTDHEFFSYKQSGIARALIRPLSTLCDRVTVVGPEIADYFVRAMGLPEQRITVVPNGVDVDSFDYDRAAARQEIGLRPHDRVVGTVGRLEPEKDQITLLEAFHRATTVCPDARLLIAGDGSMADTLKAHARQLGLEDRTLFLGYRRDIPRLLAAMDVFALTSVREGLPISLIEAMAARRPVLASKVGSVADLVRDGSNGVVVEAGDTAGFASAMQRLLCSPDLRHRLADAGRATVERSFSLSAMIRTYEDLYRTSVTNAHVWN